MTMLKRESNYPKDKSPVRNETDIPAYVEHIEKQSKFTPDDIIRMYKKQLKRIELLTKRGKSPIRRQTGRRSKHTTLRLSYIYRSITYKDMSVGDAIQYIGKLLTQHDTRIVDDLSPLEKAKEDAINYDRQMDIERFSDALRGISNVERNKADKDGTITLEGFKSDINKVDDLIDEVTQALEAGDEEMANKKLDEISTLLMELKSGVAALESKVDTESKYINQSISKLTTEQSNTATNVTVLTEKVGNVSGKNTIITTLLVGILIAVTTQVYVSLTSSNKTPIVKEPASNQIKK